MFVFKRACFFGVLDVFDARRVDENERNAVDGQFRFEIVASRSGDVGDERGGGFGRVVRSAERLNESVVKRAFTGVWKSGENDARRPVERSSGARSVERFVDFGNRVLQLRPNLVGRNELDILLDEVEPGFEVAKNVEKRFAEGAESARKVPGELLERRLEFAVGTGVDRAKYRFRLG